MTKPTREPIFTRQEQGVVYLFSRYWHKIEQFRGKRISRIHTHFPDFSFQDDGAEEAIEFEYGLGDFYSHIPGDVRKLKKWKIGRLYVVYWDEDTDKEQLRLEVKERFKGELVLVCLKDYFSPCVTPEKDRLVPTWVFAQCRQPLRYVYSFDSIVRDAKRLTAEGNFRRLEPAKRLYRIAGFNRESASFVELDHWETVHLYLTYRFGADRIPSKLLVKRSGYEHFSGFFQVDHAFHILKSSELVSDFFRQYYFFPYEHYFRDTYTCLVYSCFHKLSYAQGRRLFQYLKKRRFAFRQSSELIDDDGDVSEVDRIIGRD